MQRKKIIQVIKHWYYYLFILNLIFVEDVESSNLKARKNIENIILIDYCSKREKFRERNLTLFKIVAKEKGKKINLGPFALLCRERERMRDFEAARRGDIYIYIYILVANLCDVQENYWK